MRGFSMEETGAKEEKKGVMHFGAAFNRLNFHSV
jgi:hypothetical protein